jgi:hypothetical protein
MSFVQRMRCGIDAATVTPMPSSVRRASMREVPGAVRCPPAHVS